MRRRWWVMALTAGIMIAVVAAQRKDRPPVHVFRVTVGLKDEKPADWSGKIKVEGGAIVALEGWRFEGQDAIVSKEEWKCRTHEYIAPTERYKLAIPEKPTPEPKTKPWPNGVTLTIQGDKPQVTLTLAQGKIEFKAAELLLGEPKTFVEGQVRVERLPEVSSPRPPAPANAMDPHQDDYPAFWVRYKTNKHYLAWVSYQKSKDRVLLSERDGPDGSWSEPVEVSGAGDHFRVALASTHSDRLWVVYACQRKGNWDLYGRQYKIDDGTAKPEGDEARLTDAPGPDFWHRMTTDSKGRAWLVWQGFRDGQSDIFARCCDDKGWHDPIKVSDSKANDWDPCIAADTKEDRVWIGWDSYHYGYNGICVRSVSSARTMGELESNIEVDETDTRRNAHISLACDKDGTLWSAWEEGGDQWGKDTGLFFESTGGSMLYTNRQIQVRVRIKGRWIRLKNEFLDALPAEMRDFNELPHLQPDSEGRMWLAFRHRTCRRPREDGWAAQGRWDAFAIAFNGEEWTKPIPLQNSEGRNDMRFSSQRDRDGRVYFAYGSDHRRWQPPAMTERNLAVYVSHLLAATKLEALRTQEARGMPPRRGGPVHPKEKDQVARIRGYKIEHAGKTYRIYRGDLHRHTDISTDGVGDGSLMDLHRYGLDAAAMDFILVGDHNMGNDREYPWWRTQKANDLYTVPGAFISMYGYERSVRYPNGHRNIIWTERGHRTLPLPQQAIPAQMAADTAKLYQYLKDTGGICTAHSSATEQGTDWKEFDPKLEPIVELFQGFQSAYEMDGAPLSIDKTTKIVHQSFRPDGFVVNALDKGYRLGFQASSDHVSTHVSYACVISDDFSRKGLVEAMKARHTYAATDNIILDFRAGRLGMMGDEIATTIPEFQVTVIGTAPLDRVEVIRNGKVAHTAKPEKESEELKFTWRDPNPEKNKTSYYYLRAIQKNKHMAWASPIWVKGD